MSVANNSRETEAPGTDPLCLTDLSTARLDETITSLAGAKSYFGRVVRRWLYRKQATRFDQMSELPEAFRSTLTDRFRLRRTRLVQIDEEGDGTKRLGFSLDDGAWIESVLILDRERTTLCVSSQVGCPVRCVFCASGLRGLRRQLTPGEIVDQVLEARGRLRRPEALTNLVFMGIGEPLLNFDNLSVALATLSEPTGLGLGARRFTISTVGWPRRIGRLAALGKAYNLAISLHAADAELRRRLIPHGGQVPIQEILAAGRHYRQATGREVTFEVVLISGLNDSTQHARRIVALLRRYPCTVNLIPLNPVRELPHRPPSRSRQLDFQRILEEGGLNVTSRTPRGRGIGAACGQLRLEREP